jgi:hypothetical protein
MTEEDIDYNYAPFLRWVLIAAAVLVGLIVCWNLGVLNSMYVLDSTMLSPLILSMFVFTTVWCGKKTFYISRLQRKLDIIKTWNKSKKTQATSKLYINNLKKDVSDLSNKEDIGWFITDSLLNIGMIGTIIGFMMMLGGIDAIVPGDVEGTKELLFSMSGGMAVALITTLTGIISSQLLKFQYINLSATVIKLANELEENE